MKENAAAELSRCPECSGGTVRARYDHHPSAKAMRNLAALSTGFGFLAFFAVAVIFGTAGGMNFGYNMFASALAPAGLLLTISLLQPKVWTLSCPACRRSYYRNAKGGRWRGAGKMGSAIEFARRARHAGGAHLPGREASR